jgi:hypothetical protein
MKKKSKIERFDPATIPDLLEKAKNGDEAARHLLLYMFQRLVASLVSVCLTGKINPRSSYQRSFLKLFISASTPIENMAAKLKSKCSEFTKDELFVLGQVAVLKAIDTCEKNLASTIVIRFKEEIAEAIKEKVPTDHTDYDTIQSSFCIESDLQFKFFFDSLSPEHQDIVERLMAGEKRYGDDDGEKAGTLIKVPNALKQLVKDFVIY